MTIRYFCPAIPECCEACETLSRVVIPMFVVGGFLDHNGHNLPHLRCLLYDVYLASKKRVPPLHENGLMHIIKTQNRIASRHDKMVVNDAYNSLDKGEIGSLILKRQKESEIYLTKLSETIDAINEPSDVSKKFRHNIPDKKQHASYKRHEKHENEMQFLPGHMQA